MTQDERWLAKYNEVIDFIKANKRNPSKYYAEERNMHTFVHRCRKLINQGLLKPERLVMFNKLQELSNQYKRKNQYE